MARRKPAPPASTVCTFAEYQQTPGVNWSSLKHMLKSPRHYQHHRQQSPESHRYPHPESYCATTGELQRWLLTDYRKALA